MIGVKVICVGKLKEKFFADAADEYKKRLTRFCDLTVCELSEARLSQTPSDAEIAAALESEGKAILSEIPRGAYVFSLCIEGGELSSVKFAEKIEQLSASGTAKLCFIIGSSFGLSQSVKDRSDMKLSFSKMTFPHQLFRVLLFEQLYRAFSISHGMKYHK